MFKNKGMHFIHLSINSPLPKIEEVHHLLELRIAFVIDISEKNLDGSVLSNKIVIEGYNHIRPDHARKEAVLFVSSNILLPIVINPSYVLTQSIFTKMNLPKSKLLQSISCTQNSRIVSLQGL